MAQISAPAFMELYRINFDPNKAFVNPPKIDLNSKETYKNIAENFPYQVKGIDFDTATRDVNISDPNAIQDLYGGQTAIPNLLDQIAQVDPYIDAQRRKNLLYQQQVAGLEAAQNLAFARQMYPLISQAAQEATQRNLAATLRYEEGPKQRQARKQSAQAGEASLMNALANQTSSAANMVQAAKFRGRNIG